MMFFTFFLSGFLVLQMTNSLPSPVEGLPQLPEFSENLEVKIRDKRKSVVDVPVINLGKATPPVEVKVITTEVPTSLQKDDASIPDILSSLQDPDNVAERVKKQAIKVVPCTNTLCRLHANNDQPINTPNMIIMNQDDLAVPQPLSENFNHYMMQSRTIDPIYSFGPVSVNGNHGYGLNSASYGQNFNYPVPSRPFLTPISGYASHATIATPGGGLSYHAVMPSFASPIHHRQPINEHSFTISHTPVDGKPVMYYEAPEPIIVDAHEDQSTHPISSNAVHDVSPVSLYCQTMKSKDLAKTLTSAVNGKSNESSENAHIQRVNQIKDGITELNAAAQRIADQQEILNRMQQEGILPQKPDYMMRSADPMMMMRTHPLALPHRIPHFNPYMYHHQYQRPMFREADASGPMAVDEKDDEKAMHKAEETPKEDAKSKMSKEKPKENENTSEASDKIEKERSNMNFQAWSLPYYYQEPEKMRHYPPSFGDYYRNIPDNYMPNYRTFPAAYGVEYIPYQRSETGFPTSPLFGMRTDDVGAYRARMDDAEFVKQLLDMGKTLGVVPKDFNQSKKSTGNEKEDAATKSENVLDGFTYNDKKKNEKMDEPTSIDMNQNKQDQNEHKHDHKQDKRGLIAKKI